jgi:lipoyl(octanoyl) transferase
MSEIIQIIRLGLVPYREALRVMEECHAAVCAGAPGFILVVEHLPVVTMGNRFLPDDMRLRPEDLSEHGVDFVHIDRGGSVTVHEPGQAVVYPILPVSASRLTVKRLVWCLEEAMICVAKEHGVVAARDSINPGIWVGLNKLGAIGIRIADHVSKHGLAFNVNNSLATFRFIVPCGLHERGVTTLERELCKGENYRSKKAFDIEVIGDQIATKIISLLG